MKFASPFFAKQEVRLLLRRKSSRNVLSGSPKATKSATKLRSPGYSSGWTRNSVPAIALLNPRRGLPELRSGNFAS